jgi:hypothetical protein
LKFIRSGQAPTRGTWPSPEGAALILAITVAIASLTTRH